MSTPKIESWMKELADEIYSMVVRTVDVMPSRIESLIVRHAPSKGVNALLPPLLLEYLNHPSMDGHPVRAKMREDLRALAESVPANAPSEGVNARLLKAAIGAAALLAINLKSHNDALEGADEHSLFYGEDIATPPILNELRGAIAAAESAPAGLERELAEAALHWSVCDFADEVDFRCNGCEKARAALRKYDEAHP